MADNKLIESLIAVSARTLGVADYSPEQIEAALKTAFGLDTQLIIDQSYFIVETGSVPVACGGWSFRETLFGSDLEQNRSSKRINPANGAAKIRAFFVKPEYARMGIGSMIMHRCEEEARRAGFRKLELMATLPGVKFYLRHGFIAGKPIQYPLGGTLTIKFVPMYRETSVGG